MLLNLHIKWGKAQVTKLIPKVGESKIHLEITTNLKGLKRQGDGVASGNRNLPYAILVPLIFVRKIGAAQLRLTVT